MSADADPRAPFRRLWLAESGVCPAWTDAIDARRAPVAPPSPEPPPVAAPAPESGDAPPAGLDALREKAAGCRACGLAEGRTQVVFGVGCARPALVCIGEAPGREEDLKGEPFVGRAGRLLDRMLAAIGLDRAHIYIMNTVKCRPPGNRDPRPEEIAACRQWFDPQLAALSPKVICLLGRVAAQSVLETDAPLSALRGRWHEVRGVRARVTYHPAYLLRSPQQKARSWQDWLEIAEALRQSSAADAG